MSSFRILVMGVFLGAWGVAALAWCAGLAGWSPLLSVVGTSGGAWSETVPVWWRGVWSGVIVLGLVGSFLSLIRRPLSRSFLLCAFGLMAFGFALEFFIGGGRATYGDAQLVQFAALTVLVMVSLVASFAMVRGAGSSASDRHLSGAAPDLALMPSVVPVASAEPSLPATRPMTLEGTIASEGSRNPSQTTPGSAAQSPKEAYILDCYRRCGQVLQWDREACKDAHMAYDEDSPGYYSEGFRDCQKAASAKQEACCERCQREAYYRFGVG